MPRTTDFKGKLRRQIETDESILAKLRSAKLAVANV